MRRCEGAGTWGKAEDDDDNGIHSSTIIVYYSGEIRVLVWKEWRFVVGINAALFPCNLSTRLEKIAKEIKEESVINRTAVQLSREPKILRLRSSVCMPQNDDTKRTNSSGLSPVKCRKAPWLGGQTSKLAAPRRREHRAS